MYEPAKLSQNHREILRLSLLGMSRKDIAEQLGLHPDTVKSTICSSLGRQHLESLQENRDACATEIREELDELLPQALEAYREVLEKKVQATPMQRIKVASEVFDRTGLGKMTKVQTANSNFVATPADIIAIKAAAEGRATAITVKAKEITHEA